MARPRNETLHANVSHAIFRQFATQGFAKTTYASIAKAAGCAATTVQDYYPRKDLMAQAFFSWLIEVIRAESRDWHDGRDGSREALGGFAERFRDGTLYYGFLQHECPRYLLEITDNATLSNSILLEMARWAYTDAGHPEVMDDPAAVETIVKSLGGFHALLNYQLGRGGEFDVQRHFTDLAFAWLAILGYGREQTLAEIEPGFLDERERGELIGRVAAAFHERARAVPMAKPAAGPGRPAVRKGARPGE